MDDLAFARSLHVVAVILWMGGVGFVTTVLSPAIRRLKSPQERVAFFDAIERRFAGQARVTTLIAGFSGFYMTWRLDLWSRFSDPHFWWMHAMVAVWLIFALMLFVAEPLFLHSWFQAQARGRPEETFALIERLHRFLLTIGLLTALGAVAGGHGVGF